MKQYPNDNNHHMSLQEIEEAENVAAKVLLDMSESHDARRLAAFITLTAAKLRRAHAS